MGSPLLVEYFSALPEDALRGGLDWPISLLIAATDAPTATETRTTGKARRRAAIHIFCKQVRQKYGEGTLLRLLHSGDPGVRQAAVFALGLLGSPAVNEALAAHLHDEDDEVARQTAEAMWTLWFRGDNPGHSDELYRILRLRDPRQALAALDDLCGRVGQFAEVFNQRAVVQFRLERFEESARDCTAAMRLNPHHFGAQAGLGHCLLRLRKPKAALRAFRVALRINPRLDGIASTVKVLETRLEGEGR